MGVEDRREKGFAMKEPFQEATELIAHCESSLQGMERELEACLIKKSITKVLLVDIKNFFENLRSALDYSAHAIFEGFCTSTNHKHKIYFPYALKKDKLTDFRSNKRIEKVFPGIGIKRPDIVLLFENFQWWQAGFEWLPDFMEMNNKSKHEKFSPYTSVDGHDVKISGGGTLKLENNSGIVFGPNAVIKHAGRIIPAGGKRLDANSAADILGEEHVSVLSWTDFRFDINGASVLPFMRTVLTGVRIIVGQLSRI